MSAVYFIQAGPGGPIKIGVSRDPMGRLSSLQTGQAAPLVLLLTLPGDRSTESELHGRFKALRTTGEWFHPGADLLAFIAEQQAIAGGEKATPAVDHAAVAATAIAADVQRFAALSVDERAALLLISAQWRGGDAALRDLAFAVREMAAGNMERARELGAGALFPVKIGPFLPPLETPEPVRRLRTAVRDFEAGRLDQARAGAVDVLFPLKPVKP